MVCELYLNFLKSLTVKNKKPNYFDIVPFSATMQFPSPSNPRFLYGWPTHFYSYFLISHLYISSIEYGSAHNRIQICSLLEPCGFL